MRGILWNIRGLNHPGRKVSLESIIRENRLDFVGVQETTKRKISLCLS
jgi:exonuclease III